jgi:hypothetical protein
VSERKFDLLKGDLRGTFMSCSESLGVVKLFRRDERKKNSPLEHTHFIILVTLKMAKKALKCFSEYFMNFK